MSSKVSLLSKIFLFTMLSLIMLTSVSCSGAGGYRKFTLREGDVHFSFEYPSTYEEPFVDFSGGKQVPSITTALRPSEEKVVPDIAVTIDAIRVSERIPDPQTDLESSLQLYNKGFSRDFKLLERAPITVAGLPGEQILYSYTSVPDYYHGMKGDPTPYMAREVYFGYKGLNWEVYFTSRMDKWEEYKADFDHILETFEILK